MTCAVVVLGKHHRWCETCQQAWLVPEGIDTPCLKRDAAKDERARIVAKLHELQAETERAAAAYGGASTPRGAGLIWAQSTLQATIDEIEAME